MTRRACGLLALAVLLAMTVHARNLLDFFLSDDFLLLRRASVEPLGTWLLVPDVERSTWFRPLTEATWRLCYLAFGVNPVGHHAVSLLLHMANVTMVFLVARRWHGDDVTAFIAAALFGVHPVGPAAVAWLSARYDLLAALFVLLTVWWLLRPPSRWRLPAVGLFTACAVLSKELAYVLPVIALLVMAGRRDDARPIWRRAASPEVVVVSVAAVALFAYRYAALGSLGGYGVHDRVPPQAYWVPVVLWPFAFQALDLTPLSPRRLAAWLAIGGSGLVLASGGLTWVLCYTAIVLPVANLLPPPAAIPPFEFGRMLYLPSAFALLAVVSCIGSPPRWAQPWWRPACLALLVAMGIGSWVRAQAFAGAWRDAGRVSAAVNATLARAGRTLPGDSAIDCSALPDNVRGAYLYRNGCDDHVRLVLRDPRIRGVRFVPGIPPDPVSAGAARFAALYRLSPDGTQLTRER